MGASSKAVSRKASKASKLSGRIAARGIGEYVVALLERGRSTDEVLKAVGKRFPDAATSRASVSWYRSQAKREGKLS